MKESTAKMNLVVINDNKDELGEFLYRIFSLSGIFLRLHGSRPGVGKLFTRRARFGKTVEAAGRTLIGKQGEDLFFFFFFLEITVHVRM